MSLIDQVLSNIEIDPNTECWVWRGPRQNAGYGHIGRGKKHLIHRLTYEHFVGAIPAGLQIDHLCRVRLCCCPWHLEAVTQRENILRGEGITAVCARKTHCPRGHEFSADNTYRNPQGPTVRDEPVKVPFPVSTLCQKRHGAPLVRAFNRWWIESEAPKGFGAGGRLGEGYVPIAGRASVAGTSSNNKARTTKPQKLRPTSEDLMRGKSEGKEARRVTTPFGGTGTPIRLTYERLDAPCLLSCSHASGDGGEVKA